MLKVAKAYEIYNIQSLTTFIMFNVRSQLSVITHIICIEYIVYNAIISHVVTCKLGHSPHVQPAFYMQLKLIYSPARAQFLPKVTQKLLHFAKNIV